MTDVMGNKIQSKMIELKEENPNLRCDFCKKSEIKTQEWGGFYCLEDVTVHYFCLLFSSGLHQNGEDDEGILGFMVADIKKEIRRGKKLRCKYCKQNGATVGCAVGKCKCSFHYNCGLPMGTLNCFVDKYESYCPNHKPEFRIPDDLEDHECILCMSDLIKDQNPVWSPCCKTRVFHRECIQAYAYSAGYYHFKCPHCNSKKKFRTAMQKSGIYVPERDAAWETEPNAFADLNQVYSSCDARRCLCPKGKDFQDNAQWKIYRCTTCGGSAIHQRCGKVNSTKWICEDCFPVVGEGPSSRHLVTPLRQVPARSNSSSDEESDENEELSDNQMSSNSGKSDEFPNPSDFVTPHSCSVKTHAMSACGSVPRNRTKTGLHSDSEEDDDGRLEDYLREAMKPTLESFKAKLADVRKNSIPVKEVVTKPPNNTRIHKEGTAKAFSISSKNVYKMEKYEQTVPKKTTFPPIEQQLTGRSRNVGGTQLLSICTNPELRERIKDQILRVISANNEDVKQNSSVLKAIKDKPRNPVEHLASSKLVVESKTAASKPVPIEIIISSDEDDIVEIEYKSAPVKRKRSGNEKKEDKICASRSSKKFTSGPHKGLC